MSSLMKRSLAELLGTFLLVYFGAGSAAITLMIAKGSSPPNPFNIGIGTLGGLGDWFAIGMAFAIGGASLGMLRRNMKRGKPASPAAADQSTQD